MNKFFEIASKISSVWSLAAFAIIALILLVTQLKGRKVPPVAWAVVIGVVMIALAPILAPEYMTAYGIYRVRVMVLDERRMPTNDAKVTCSVGGEVKKVEGGWEFNIPAKTRPADRRIQVYASEPDAFLTGRAELELKNDYSPVVTIALSKDTSAKIIGIVLGEDNALLDGVRVSVVGYETEGQVTQTGGNFSLPAHCANGQQVQVSASKSGYRTAVEWHQAGDFPVTITLPAKAKNLKQRVERQ